MDKIAFFGNVMEMDFRFNYLCDTIEALGDLITSFKKKNEEIDYYDGLFLLEDSEQTYGLAFIAMQNYIISSANEHYLALKQGKYISKQKVNIIEKNKKSLNEYLKSKYDLGKIIRNEDDDFIKFEVDNSEKKLTDIILIITLANYYKHRDEIIDLQDRNVKVLNSLNLKYQKEDFDIGSSPIIEGIELLSENWDLMEIVKNIKAWREKLWDSDGHPIP